MTEDQQPATTMALHGAGRWLRFQPMTVDLACEPESNPPRGAFGMQYPNVPIES